ncbi:MAG: hypothetical protein FJ034_04050 [Chloroflexi bacterium]|nr:hypothetical protein [Chloroflexota bacterium]
MGIENDGARFETLLSRERGDPLPLPVLLRERYGELRLPRGGDRPYVIANFVSTLDGVVSYGTAGRATARHISRGSDADRFLMGLLRACADAILVGAATLRIERPRAWTPAAIHPASAAAFAELRAALGKKGDPAPVVVSGSGAVDARALGPDARVLAGARTGEGILDAVTSETGARLILCEGGPRLFGRLLAARRIDELFLTLSPALAGRSAGEPRRALVEDTAFAPEEAPWGRPVGVRRAGEMLFLRYELSATP